MRGDITITETVNPGGSKAWQVCGMVDGKRRRKNFSGADGEALALTTKQNWERERMNLSPLPTITTRLTDAQCHEAEACFHRLNGFPLSLSKCVDFAVEHYQPSQKEVTIRAGFDLFIAEKRTLNKREGTVENLEQRLGALPKAKGGLVKVKGDGKAHEILAADLKPLIFIAGTSARNQHNQWLAFSNFFGWLKAENYIPSNPMDSIAAIQVDETEPVSFTVEQSREMMRRGEVFEDGSLVPSLALCLFCAIRPEQEIARLSKLPHGGWEKIDLDEKTITFDGKLAKMRKRRTVTIPDNAVEWLRPHALKRTPFVCLSTSDAFQRLRGLCGWTTRGNDEPGKTAWVQDILRHTAISFHLAKHNDENLTASWAGNSPDIVHDKYKSLMKKPRDVADFYGILPGGGKVVQLPAQRNGLTYASLTRKVGRR